MMNWKIIGSLLVVLSLLLVVGCTNSGVSVSGQATASGGDFVKKSDLRNMVPYVVSGSDWSCNTACGSINKNCMFALLGYKHIAVLSDGGAGFPDSQVLTERTACASGLTGYNINNVVKPFFYCYCI